MPNDVVTLIEPDCSSYPAALHNGPSSGAFPRLWAIGNLAILDRRLLGLFCSTTCPGEVILRTYDLARALRDAGIPVIGGFHSPMEKECLELLFRGRQPIVVCPARSVERMRLPATWRKPLAEGRLLVLSPFEARHGRPTAELAVQRNRFVAALADEIFVAHAAANGKTERFCAGLMTQGRRLYTFDLEANGHLVRLGAVGGTVSNLVAFFAK